MELLHAIIFGVIEGFTEFLPISSTGHLTIAEKLLGYQIDDPAITAFTAFVQVGATLATVLYFRKDIWRLITGFLKGLTDTSQRGADFRMGVGVIVGSIPIAVIGLLFKDQIETTLRSMWVIAFALIFWSGVMYFAERYAKADRKESSTTWKDTLFIGVAQCLALIPGVSRSGATISASFVRGFDKVTATRLSFFLSIPALVAAGVLQVATEADAVGERVGWTPTIVATVISFVVGYLAVAWLLKFISTNSFKPFIVYRLVLGSFLIVLLSTGVISA